jgi:membrane-bound serine protease (ClpP class)
MIQKALRVTLCCLMMMWPSVAVSTNDVGKAVTTVPVIKISGAIGPAVGDYVTKEIDRANHLDEISALIIAIDTPGGLVSSLRDINQSILSSNVPILCLVYPQGARAASAGTYILYACHIAAMSPATTLGAATPVSIGGPAPNQADDKSGEPTAMEKKVLNDSIAYIRSLAQLRERNAEWAEAAVRDAATLSFTEALEKNVINVIADSPRELLDKLHGQRIKHRDNEVILQFSSVELDPREPDWRNQFLATMTDPNIAYLLMIIGVYGLLLEFYSPGFGVAGVAGSICLLIATYAFQMLPINYVGVGLILLGLGLLVAESMVPSFGLLGFGGVIAFILGSIFLIDSDIPELRVSLNLIYILALSSAAFVAFVLRRLWQLRKRPIVSGVENLVGCRVTIEHEFAEQGYVILKGERWAARGVGQFVQGDEVVVEAVVGLTLQIRKQ